MHDFYNLKMKNIKYIFVLLFIAISFFAIYKLVYKMFDKYNDNRLDPIEFSEIKIDTTQIYDWTLLGDSHTYYWKMNQQNVLNLGIGGQTSGQILVRSLLMQNQLKGKNLILSIGANDVKSIATNPERKQEIIENCITNIQEIVSVLKPKFEKIYIITIPPDFDVSWQQRLFNYQETVVAKDELNARIKTLAQKNNLVLIDTFTILKGKDKMSEDGVHMNQKAYEILNRHLK